MNEVLKSSANVISITRIFLVLALFFTKPLSIPFFVIYFICGISDVLDGYIARKTNTASPLGEKLDTAADMIMVAVLTIILYPMIGIPPKILYWIIGIALIRFVSIAVLYIKYKIFGMLHTIGNKITGLMLFFVPVMLQSKVFMIILCTAASLSALEELFIHLFSKKLEINKKSIFYTPKNKTFNES